MQCTSLHDVPGPVAYCSPDLTSRLSLGRTLLRAVCVAAFVIFEAMANDGGSGSLKTWGKLGLVTWNVNGLLVLSPTSFAFAGDFQGAN